MGEEEEERKSSYDDAEEEEWYAEVEGRPGARVLKEQPQLRPEGTKTHASRVPSSSDSSSATALRRDTCGYGMELRPRVSLPSPPPCFLPPQARAHNLPLTRKWWGDGQLLPRHSPDSASGPAVRIFSTSVILLDRISKSGELVCAGGGGHRSGRRYSDKGPRSRVDALSITCVRKELANWK